MIRRLPRSAPVAVAIVFAMLSSSSVSAQIPPPADAGAAATVGSRPSTPSMPSTNDLGFANDPSDAGASASTQPSPDSRALPAWAPRLTQSVAPAVVSLGDPVKVTLKVRHAKAVSVNLPLQLELGKFSELSRSEATEDLSKKGHLGEVEHRFVLDVAAYEVGELTLPAIEVTALGPGGELVSLRTGPIPVRVKGVLGNEPSPKLRGLEPPISVFQRSWLLLYLLIVLAAVGIVVAVTLLVNRRLRTKRDAAKPPPPPIPAHITALERLAAIDLESYLEAERYKELYLLLSEIVRAYVGGRYGFDALEMTTTEINETLLRKGASVETLGRFESYFASCDLVKFAKYRPESVLARRAKFDAEELVRIDGGDSLGVALLDDHSSLDVAHHGDVSPRSTLERPRERRARGGSLGASGRGARGRRIVSVETRPPEVSAPAPARTRVHVRHGDRAILVALVLLVAGPVAAYLAWDLGKAGTLSFKHPFALVLLLAVPLAFWVRISLGARRSPHLAFSSTTLLSQLRHGVVSRLSTLPGVLRAVAIGLLAVALARPQTRDRGGHVEVEGIDIVVALDLSNSMEAIDLQPNRLEAAKRVLDDFISRRRSDRIGLVVFGKEAFTHCPLTLDYSALRTMLAELRLNAIDGSATAIGNALGVSLARLRKSDAKSKVAILLTDGENNSGNVTPLQAARYAQAMGVKVFTILMGAREGTAVGGRDPFGRPIQVQRQYPVNPKLLQEIAQQTGGKPYLATDRESLEKNFEGILNELDKTTRRDVAAVYLDAFRPFAAFGLGLLLFEILLGLTRMRRFP